LNELCEKQKEVTLLENYESSVEQGVKPLQGGTKIISGEMKSENKKAMEFQSKESKFQFGLQVDPTTKTFSFGLNKEQKKTQFTIYSEQSTSQRVETKEEGLGQKIIQEVKNQTEQELQAQILEQTNPKPNNS